MIWILLLSIAISLVLLSQRVNEEVHALAVQVTGLISFIWGFSWAPPTVQVLITSIVGTIAFLGKRS